ncbi:MAG: HAD family hydrolase [Thermoanaerobaculales bacterium]
MRRLILFDIDGTLLSTDGRAGEALGLALAATFGTAGPIAGYSFAGKTDPQIVFELMAPAGIPGEVVKAKLPQALEAYCLRLERTLTPANIRVLPGVHELLGALERRSDTALGLLTGNIRAGAAIKLGVACLGDRFTIGAFGSDDADRDHLVAVARRRAQRRWGEEFAGTRTVVVGDAEADVRCARSGGAWSVAVASGKTPHERLAAMAPDVLLSSLAAPQAITGVLGPAS